MENDKIRYFSMFTGVGGFELGLEQANKDGDIRQQSSEQLEYLQQSGNMPNDSSRERWRLHQYKTFSCIGFSEIDKHANQLLACKYPNIPNFGDCTKINPSELPDFDMLCGGFPCQSFSIAGKRRGFQDTRGTMFFEVARILEVKRPQLVFLENVKGLLNHDKGKTFSVILQTLEELGYEVQWMVLNSKFFGVPQNRERVFIIGSLRGTSRPEILPFRTDLQQTAQQHSSKISGAIAQRYYKQGNADTYIIHNVYGGFGEGIREQKETCPTIRTPKGGGHLPMIAIPYQNMLATKTRDVEEALFIGKIIASQENKPVQIDLLHLKHGEIRPLSTYIPQNEDARCVQAGEPKEILIEPSMKIRRLTPIECERLQGFPDNWTAGFSDTQRYKMMGNAVTTKVIKAIANKLNLYHKSDTSLIKQK